MEFAQAEVSNAGLQTGPHKVSQAELRAVPQMPALAAKLCADSHANDPASVVCRICERAFDPASEIVTMTPSVVARLLLEDGSAIDVDNRLLIGRSPITDEPLDTLTVAGRQVSRHHALLETRGWELYIRDYDSTNGTFLTRRGERGRRRVPSDESILVRIGDSIHFGSRQALVVQPKAD
ncbi:MAG: FHA domain-containing protein [Acidimicrobiales bacterium]